MVFIDIYQGVKFPDSAVSVRSPTSRVHDLPPAADSPLEGRARAEGVASARSLASRRRRLRRRTRKSR